MKLKRLLLLLLSLVFLTSFISTPKAVYLSPEGIQFVSYSDKWDKNKLKKLYEELLKNTHGKELNKLKAIKLYSDKNKEFSGEYSILSKTISLYDADTHTSPKSMRHTLSHEYGHHVAFTYLFFDQLPFSNYEKLRKVHNVVWNPFLYHKKHDQFISEIIADDYAVLFGPKKDIKKNVSSEKLLKMNVIDMPKLNDMTIPYGVFSNFDNKELQTYFEQKTGFTIDQSRKLQNPTLVNVNENTLTVKTLNRKNLITEMNVSYYQKENGQLYFVKNASISHYAKKSNEHVSFNLNQAFDKDNEFKNLPYDHFKGYILVYFYTVDPKSYTLLTSKTWFFKKDRNYSVVPKKDFIVQKMNKYNYK